MAYFPFFAELKDRPGLIVGGGSVALRKTEKLLPYGPSLCIVAPELREEFYEIPGLRLEKRTFCPEDVENIAFVIAATDDRAVNRAVALLCREKKIPVNVADSEEDSSFLFPALVKRGDLSVGISTGGSSPTAARWVKEQVEAALPENFDRLLEELQARREEILASGLEAKERSALLRRLFYQLLEEQGGEGK